jgi:excisionase family DNA binding protein
MADMESTAPVSIDDRTGFPRLFTPQEVAELIGASERTVRRLAQEGVLDRVRIGHRTSRYTSRSVLALIDPSNSDAPVEETEAPRNSGGQSRRAPV